MYPIDTLYKARYSASMTIKQLRKALGLTQEALAQELNVSFVSVNRWESGKAKPSRLAQEKIDALIKQAQRSADSGE